MRGAGICSAVVVLVTAVACTDGPAGIDPADAASVRVDFEVVAGEAAVGQPVPLHDLLVARRWRDADPGPQSVHDLVVSRDLGSSWETVDLPGRPETMDVEGLWRIDGGLAVSGDAPFEDQQDAAGYAYLWVSSDGVEWRGGRIPVAESTEGNASVGHVWNRASGDLVVNIEPHGDPQPLSFQSIDGVTWEATDCQAHPEMPLDCYDVERHGGLWARNGRHWGGRVELSDDEGESWFVPEVPSVSEDEITDFSLVERDSGGWLAAVTEPEQDSRETWDEHVLVRSDDGREWEVVFEHDSRCADGNRRESISTPVALDRQWLVAYRCNRPVEAETGPELSRLYVLDADGTDLRVIAGSVESTSWYGQPITIEGVVMVPVRSSGTGELDEFRLFDVAVVE